MNETVTTILSSGFISFVVTLLVCMTYLGKYKEKIDTHEKNIDNHNKKISELIEGLAFLKGGLDRDRAVSDYFKSKSPLSLTDKGKAVLLDSRGKDYIDSRKNKFLEEIKSEKPKTAYDVQELAKKVIEKRISYDEFNDIKEYAFKNALKLDLILEILGLYLRDLVLPEFGFKVEEIKE